MLSLGMNAFINAQGFANIGMMTVSIGAVCNLILDPIFIFEMKMGVQGAALATVISQFAAACWTLRFLTGKKATIRLDKNYLKLKQTVSKDSCARFIRFYYVGDEQPRADGMQYQSGDVRWRYVYRSDDHHQFCA